MFRRTNDAKDRSRRLWPVMVLTAAGLMLWGVWMGTARPALAQSTAVALTADEIASLNFMREEEKLAHDVYITLYQQWGMPVFANIAAAEETHANAIITLLDRYGLDDPAAGNAVGVFTNPDLQVLYDQLVARGGQSWAEALLVGGWIEETDILDLETSLTIVSQPDIRQVFTNLRAGSGNHLRAFAGLYEEYTGEAYPAQVMDPADVAAIREGGGSGNGRQGWRGGR